MFCSSISYHFLAVCMPCRMRQRMGWVTHFLQEEWSDVLMVLTFVLSFACKLLAIHEASSHSYPYAYYSYSYSSPTAPTDIDIGFNGNNNNNNRQSGLFASARPLGGQNGNGNGTSPPPPPPAAFSNVSHAAAASSGMNSNARQLHPLPTHMQALPMGHQHRTPFPGLYDLALECPIDSELWSLHSLLLSFAALLTVLRLTKLFSIHHRLGPMWISVQKMQRDVLVFAVLLFVCIAAFAFSLTYLLRTASAHSAAGIDERARPEFQSVSSSFTTLLWASFGVGLERELVDSVS